MTYCFELRLAKPSPQPIRIASIGGLHGCSFALIVNEPTRGRKSLDGRQIPAFPN